MEYIARKIDVPLDDFVEWFANHKIYFKREPADFCNAWFLKYDLKTPVETIQSYVEKCPYCNNETV